MEGKDAAEEEVEEMRVCPNCHYKEFIWRHLQHGRFTDYCHINELDLDSPKLAEKIRKTPKFFTDGLYNYQLFKSGYVHRIWKDDAESPNTVKEPDMEKPKNRTPFATIIKRPNLLPQREFVTKMREFSKGKELFLTQRFGDTIWKHWIRYDKSGFYYPSAENWKLIKQYFDTPQELDVALLTETISEQRRLLEEPAK